MKVGLYFGSFNPVHHGHLIIASHVVQSTGLDQVWFVVSPQNPLKPAVGLLNEYHRLHLIRAAIDGERSLRATDIEFKLPKPSYTIDTLTYIREKYPQHEFSIIMGSDSYQNLGRWKPCRTPGEGSYSRRVSGRPAPHWSASKSAGLRARTTAWSSA